MTWIDVSVGMGSNLGDRFAHLVHGVSAMRGMKQCRHYRFSSIYETAPVDCQDDLPFLNAVSHFETSLEPLHLLEELLKIEHQLGRQRPYPNAPRPLDLDLLFYGDVCMKHPQLHLPHPRIHERLFVLVPLEELRADHTHPVLGKTIKELTQEQKRVDLDASVICKSHRQWPDELLR